MFKNKFKLIALHISNFFPTFTKNKLVYPPSRYHLVILRFWKSLSIFFVTFTRLTITLVIFTMHLDPIENRIEAVRLSLDFSILFFSFSCTLFFNRSRPTRAFDEKCQFEQPISQFALSLSLSQVKKNSLKKNSTISRSQLSRGEVTWWLRPCVRQTKLDIRPLSPRLIILTFSKNCVIFSHGGLS